MPRLALVTCEELPLLDPDEQFVLPALAERGVDADSVPWTAGHAALAGYDAVVVRSCWDYHLQPDAFLSWIDGLGRLGMPIWNPPHVLRWNLDKRHLLELQDAGVPVAWTGRDGAVSIGRGGREREANVSVEADPSARGFVAWAAARRCPGDPAASAQPGGESRPPSVR